MTESFDEIRGSLRSFGRVWIYLGEYRVAHGYLHVIITRESFRSRLANLYFADSGHIYGPTSGGPWTVAVEEEIIGEQREVVFNAGNGILTIRALRIRAEWLQEPTENAAG